MAVTIELTKDDIGLLLQLTEKHKVNCIRNAHIAQGDKFFQNEVDKAKRVNRVLYDAWVRLLS
jgi:hypothetical protein